MKVLITGFGRFLNNDINPTKEVLGLLPKSIYGNELIKVELPVIFDECFDYLKPFIEEHTPGAIIMLGLAGGRNAITPERIAVNIKDSEGPDNIGYTPRDEAILAEGQNAYFTTLPIRVIEEKLKEKHIPCTISNNAGLYVCNNIMYHVLHYIDHNNLEIKAGFIHVPYMDSQVTDKNVFSLPIDIILEGVIDSIKTIL